MSDPTDHTQAAEKAQPSMGQWARDIADSYTALAARDQWDMRKAALLAEASKYYGIADRMDRSAASRNRTPPGQGSDQ